jgi:hypothetical protein
MLSLKFFLGLTVQYCTYSTVCLVRRGCIRYGRMGHVNVGVGAVLRTSSCFTCSVTSAAAGKEKSIRVLRQDSWAVPV